MHIYKELTVVIELGVFTQDDGAFSYCPLCSFPAGSVCTARYGCHSRQMIHRYFFHKHWFDLLQNLSEGERDGLLENLHLVQVQSELVRLEVDLMSD